MIIAGELAELRQSLERSKVQLLDSQQCEKVLIRRLTAKEHEMQDYVVSKIKTPLCHMFLTVYILKCLVCAAEESYTLIYK